MNFINRTGETQLNNFGSIMIIEQYRGSADVDVYFPEYNWTAYNIQYGQFKRGTVKCPYERRTYKIGYVGEGIYNISENGKNTRVYDTWVRMLERCYEPSYQVKYPTYRGCKVCDDWHNFQNFAEWYELNYYEVPGQTMNLDKDILYKGNKIYSPGTCVFVPQCINKIFTKSDSNRGSLPIGVYYSERDKRYIAQCSVRCNADEKRKHLGYFHTPEEAFLAYKQFKEAYINKVANDFIEYIPFNLYQTMINYEVEIED